MTVSSHSKIGSIFIFRYVISNRGGLIRKILAEQIDRQGVSPRDAFPHSSSQYRFLDAKNNLLRPVVTKTLKNALRVYSKRQSLIADITHFVLEVKIFSAPRGGRHIYAAMHHSAVVGGWRGTPGPLFSLPLDKD